MSSYCRTSGPPVLWMRTAFTGLTQMLTEERVGAGIGEVGAGLVVMLAAFAREGVIHFRVDMDRHQRIAFQAVHDLFLRFGGAVPILAGDVKHHGLFDLARFVQAV